MQAFVRQQLIEEKAARRTWGESGPIPSILAWDKRIVACHNRLLSLPADATYHDFLGLYIKETLGVDWWRVEDSKSDAVAHQLIVWQRKVQRFQFAQIIGRGRDRAPTRGVVDHYYRLAFDLHTIEHQGLLQDRLVKRLRIPDQFQGARYEVITCAAFVRAGFDIRLEDESSSSVKVCEFVATHQATGKSYSVEAKSRHFGGVLGRQPTSFAVSNGPDEPNVKRLILKALAKSAEHTRVICVDVNRPQPLDTQPENTWGPVIRKQVDELEAQQFGPAILVLTNSPEHYLNDDELAHGTAAGLMAIGEPRFRPDDSSLVEANFPGLLRLISAFSKLPKNWE